MILISPTAFKGTLTPYQAARLLASAAKKTHPQEKIKILPLADGGDGTLEVLSLPLKARALKTRVTGPLGQPVSARWGITPAGLPFRGKTALLEMAEASGLKRLKGKNKILKASSVGTGQLIKAALDHGCRNILIGVGGTATADGGAGALEALGLRYFDRQGRRLSAHLTHLIHIHRVDWKNFDPRVRKTNITVLCDVKNPLLGAQGSARVFGPQKGASPRQVAFIEKFLTRWARLAKVKAQTKPGSGAAGAMAFGLAGFAGAHLVEGSTFIVKTLQWKNQAKKAAVILTGEGRVDHTSFSGKVLGAVLKDKSRANVYVVCGSTDLSLAELKKRGICGIEKMGKKGLKFPRKILVESTEKIMKLI